MSLRPRFAPLILLNALLLCAAAPAAGEEVAVAARLVRDAAGSLEARVSFAIAPGVHLYAPGEETGLPVRIEALPPATAGAARFPPPLVKRYEALGGDLKLYEGSLEVALPLTPGAGAERVAVEAAWQACTDTQCRMPAQRRFDLSVADAEAAAAAGAAGTPPPAVKGPPPASPAADPTAGAAPAAPAPRKEGAFERAHRESGLLWVLALAFGLGLLSSLTPCVYPMIPITVAFFGGQAGEKRSAGRKAGLALVFALGIGASFALLGGLLTWLGRDLGSIFASPAAASLIAAVLFLFALASFEWIEFKPPAFLMARLGGGQGGDGVAGALVMGLTLGLVAAPCVGPFAGSLLLFVAALGSVPLGFLLLFVYGLGLGTLFMVVALGATFLPRAGGWMVTLKNAFGIVILLTTVYVIEYALPTWFTLVYAGFALLLSAVVCGLFEPAPAALTGRFALARAFALLFLVAGIVHAGVGFTEMIHLGDYKDGAPHLLSRPAAEQGAPGVTSWFHDHDAALRQGALERKPVLVDFYADWCLPCKQLAQLFAEPEVAAELARFVVAKLDCTAPDMPGAVVKHERYNAPYMPFVVLYDAAGKRRADLDIEGYVGKEELLARLKAVR